MTDETFPSILYRNTEQQHADAFVQEGELLFRPLTHYRSIEGHKKDEYEGQLLTEPNRLVIRIWDEELQEYVAPMEMFNPKFVHKLISADDYFISCFALAPQPQHGPATIEFFDVHGFFSGLRLVFAEQLGVELKFGQVNYYDPIEQASHPEIPTELAFYKRCCFQDEQEFRFVFRLNAATKNMLLESCEKTNPRFGETLKDSLKMRVGNLTDFARVMRDFAKSARA